MAGIALSSTASITLVDCRATQPTCPTPCDPDCDASCHSGHHVTSKKDHPDGACQGIRLGTGASTTFSIDTPPPTAPPGHCGKPPLPALAALWGLCADWDGWHFTVAVDQWWGVTGECHHGSWSGASNGALDLETAFWRIYEQARETEHPAMGEA